ncbi:MAG TPA: hypothetical protein VLJ16_06565, partial [Acidobacteriota bacterium]|nr:hypothetical protein [Acidobacteriota bacterium]
MKRSAPAILALVLILPALARAADVRFVSPTWEAPRYEIRLPFTVDRVPFTFKELRLDSAAIPSARVFKAGKLADISKTLEKGDYEVVIDHAWLAGKRYSLEIFFHGKNPAKLEK